ncbi:MAG: replication restart helicase PriA [Christensenellales bacterium]
MSDPPRFPPYAEVIVEISAENIDRTYVYRTSLPLSVGDRVLVPFGRREIEGYVLELKNSTDFPEEKIRDVIGKIDDESALLPELIELSKWMKAKYRCNLVDCLRLMIPAQMRGGRVRPLVRKAAALKQPQLIREDFGRATRQFDVFSLLLKNGGEMFVSEIERLLPGSYSVVSAMEKKGIIDAFEKPLRRAPYKAAEIGEGRLLSLIPAQQRAVDEISSAMEKNGGRFLLHGVTGSGKTEIYCHLVKKALDMGRQAIVLVPEIALTPQMVGWFIERFGDTAAVLHSRLSPGERFDEWWRIRTGQARVVVGARSAIFAPVSDIGVIVVDEEHESYYSAESSPAYDAREVAIKRCEQHSDGGAVLVLGSATPQIKTYLSALRGYYTLIELRSRVTGMPMPTVHIVDMRRELVLGNRSIFSGDLVKALEECFDKGEQAMLFLNRRGYNTFVSCRSCGKTVKCQYCDVSMTYHFGIKRLKCHYCGAEKSPPRECPSCGSGLIRYFGSGTEKLEDELQKFFPDVSTCRMDADTTSGKDGHRKVLDEFRSGRAQALVGTQMIAKGHDFPMVTVVGVVAADMMLSMPDYRSAERTFCLLTQVAGRAGRADRPGQVFFQTYDPDHYAITYAAKQDYRAFYNEEIANRRRGLFPPYTVHARLLFTGDNPAGLEAAADAAQKKLELWFFANPDQKAMLAHMRHMEAPIGLIKGRYRWQLFLKINAKAPEAIIEKLAEIAAEGFEAKNLECKLEVNPTNMM